MKFILVFSIFMLSISASSQVLKRETNLTKKKKKNSVNVVIDFEPKKVVMEGKPGEIILVPFEVKNTTKKEVKAKFYLKEFHVLETGRYDHEKINKGLKGPLSLIDFAKVSEDSFMMPPESTKKTTIKVTLPPDFKGTKALLMTAKVDPDWKKRQKRTSSIDFTFAYTGPLIITSKNKGDINIITKNRVQYKNNKLRFQSLMELNADIFIGDLKASITLLDKDNNKIYGGNLNNFSPEIKIYPQTKRKFSGSTELTLEKGNYTYIISYFSKEAEYSKTFREEFMVK